MVLKKNKNDDSGLSSSKKTHEHTDRYALSKNNGESVKYRIRKQEERESLEELKKQLERNGEDDGIPFDPYSRH